MFSPLVGTVKAEMRVVFSRDERLFLMILALSPHQLRLALFSLLLLLLLVAATLLFLTQHAGVVSLSLVANPNIIHIHP